MTKPENRGTFAARGSFCAPPADSLIFSAPQRLSAKRCSAQVAGALILLTLLAVSPVRGAEPPQFQCDLVSGGSSIGTLVELSPQQLVLKTDKGNKSFKLSDVRFVGWTGKPARDPGAAAAHSATVVWLETVDGSRLKGTDYAVAKGTARFKLLSGERIELPAKAIQQVEFTTIGGPASGWPAAAKEVAGDVIILKKKDALDMVEGAVADVTPDAVQFVIEGETTPVKRAKVAGLVYFHAAESAATPDPNCVIREIDGGELKAQSVTLADGKLQIKTSFGSTVTRPLEAIRAIDFSSSRVIYLSDMPLESTDWTPYIDFGKRGDILAQYYRPRRDKSLDNGPLRLGGKTYQKGLAAVSRTEMEFKLAGKGRRFQAVAGIDDAVRKLGNVQLTIEGDGKRLYSSRITGRDAPVPLDLDVAAVKRLKIVVDFGGGLEMGDYLDLCDARIVK